MSPLADRLREAARLSQRSTREARLDDGAEGTNHHQDEAFAPAEAPDHCRRHGAPASGAAADSIAAETLGGEWCEANGRRFLVVDRKYSAGYRHGRVAVSDAAPGSEGWRRFHLLSGAEASTPSASRLLFFDLETTGLAGGAGSYAFLVGCGWFESGTFRVRQFFLSSFAAERALLEAVGELAQGAAAVVTYNGKTFDLPLIETRYALHRLPTPFGVLAHTDMLHPARRLWRSEERDADGESSCRLSVLERTLCGHEREGDVPGFEIPARYFQYVRSGDPRPLAAVLEHNRLDLLSLACVASRASQLLDEGPSAAGTAREALGLAQLYERGGMSADACASYQRAVKLPGDVTTQANALRGLACLSRRQRRYGDAAEAWRRLVQLRGCPGPIVREAIDALAVHHEHRVRDLEAARTFAVQSLSLQASPSRREASQHRLARLNRKLGASAEAALF